MSTETIEKTNNATESTTIGDAAETNVPLVSVDTALISLRSSGHDPQSALGEVIDNSIEAMANNIKVRFFKEQEIVGNNTRRTEVITQVAIGDDGNGMDKSTLHQALSLGFSTRFNQRKGMGRFGVGAKLAAISQAKRIELYSKQDGGDWLWTYIDLDEVASKSMTVIPEPVSKPIPSDCKDLVGEGSGTLTIWSKTDHLKVRDSGKARKADSLVDETLRYISQTFRKFLDSGINIELDEVAVKPHDPLYLMTTTKLHAENPEEPVATIEYDESFEMPIPTKPDESSKVHVTITLLPEAFRMKRGKGGSNEALKRRIEENSGKISILRAQREIFFGALRNVAPTIKEADRFIGIEIRFDPDLDEYFAVRNVKKGAEPIEELRDKLRERIYKRVADARKRVQDHWDRQEAKEQEESGPHKEAEDVASKAGKSGPKPKAGTKTEPGERKRKIRTAAEKLAGGDTEKADELEKELENLTVKIVPTTFPGSELFEIDHLGVPILVNLNMRHPFYTEVYSKLLAAQTETANSDEATQNLARLAQVGLDLVLCAYAMAEGMNPDPAATYADLRTYLGVHLKNMVNEWRPSQG